MDTSIGCLPLPREIAAGRKQYSDNEGKGCDLTGVYIGLNASRISQYKSSLRHERLRYIENIGRRLRTL
jgi:hypothetical protein